MWINFAIKDECLNLDWPVFIKMDQNFAKCPLPPLRYPKARGKTQGWPRYPPTNTQVRIQSSI